MNLTLGLFGVAGFLSYELSFLLNILKSGTRLEKEAVKSASYFCIVSLFSIVVFIVTCIFTIPDIAENVWPGNFRNIGIYEAARAIVVGLATVHIYKNPGKLKINGVRVETTKADINFSAGVASIHGWWRHYKKIERQLKDKRIKDSG